MQYTFVTKFLPVDFEGTLYNSALWYNFETNLSLGHRLLVPPARKGCRSTCNESLFSLLHKGEAREHSAAGWAGQCHYMYTYNLGGFKLTIAYFKEASILRIWGAEFITRYVVLFFTTTSSNFQNWGCFGKGPLPSYWNPLMYISWL